MKIRRRKALPPGFDVTQYLEAATSQTIAQPESPGRRFSTRLELETGPGRGISPTIPGELGILFVGKECRR
jgi:hypothetical protein